MKTEIYRLYRKYAADTEKILEALIRATREAWMKSINMCCLAYLLLWAIDLTWLLTLTLL
jgi:hypothetical protein